MNPIPIAKPDIGPLELKNLLACGQSGWISQGKFVQQAEDRLKEITGRKYAVCCSSGTTALQVAVMVVQPKKNPLVQDWNVAVPAMTFAAVHNVVRLAGGTPVYMGADDSYQTTKEELYCDLSWDAAIVAPCYGHLGPVINSERQDMTCSPVIEDAAESFGGSLNGRPAGSFMDISCISFYANKIVTAGEGGAVLTDDRLVANQVRLIINHGIRRNFVPLMTGFNGRMTDLQAAILCAQLERMPKMIDRRRQVMARYYEAAAPFWKLPTPQDGEIPAPWLFAGIPPDIQDLTRRCRHRNMEWRPFFPVPPEAPDTDSIATARSLSGSGVLLPLSSAMTDEEVESVCEVIRGN